jgi:hypothetical protein
VLGLGIQIIEIPEGARREERFAYMANGPLDSSFFVFMGSSP